MKKIYIVPIALLLAGYTNTLQAQNTLVNTGGAKIVITTGTDFRANHIRNEGTGSQITNNGDLYLKGNFNQTTGATYTGSASSWLWFEGTSTQTISSDATLDIARLKINNANGMQLSRDINVANNLEVVQGDLDLNGNNINLGSTGTLTEDRANNHLVTDNTALSDAVSGGGIIFTGNVTTSSTEIAGTGLYLQRTVGSDYAVTVTRKHYKGAVSSRGGHGIERIYAITGSPTGTNTIMRIYYASDETTGVVGSYVLYRWQSGTGWKKATDAGSGFANGINVGSYVEATNINGFSTWTVGAEETPLPITLMRFTGERINGGTGEPTEEVRLDWSTASEINNKGFEVEVSENGLAYQKIAFVDGKGNGSTVSSYQLAVNNADDGYYRLRQVDFDGTFSYSPVVFVEGIKSLKVYPNPTKGKFTIALGKASGVTQARLLNTQGVEVWRGILPTEQNTLELRLPAGMYFLHTAGVGKAKVTKVIIYQ